MLTKDSPTVQNLLTRIQAAVPGITGPLKLLWDHPTEVGIEMTFNQEPPTELLREFRPGHYSIQVLYASVEIQLELGWWKNATTPVWAVEDHSYGQWFIPFIPEEDDALLDALMKPNTTGMAEQSQHL